MKTPLTYLRALPEDAEKLTATAIASKRYWSYPDDLIQLWTPDLTISREYIQHNKDFMTKGAAKSLTCLKVKYPAGSYPFMNLQQNRKTWNK